MIKVGDLYRKSGSRWTDDKDDIVVIAEVSGDWLRYRYITSGDDSYHSHSGRWSFEGFNREFTKVTYD